MYPTIIESREELEKLAWRSAVVRSNIDAIATRKNLPEMVWVAGRVSIITVCFNAAKSIPDAFKSVKRQTYQDIEYIVIDGGSTDGTVELIEQTDINIDVALSMKDKGIADAFNRGVALACGEYIAFLNADDLWPADHIQESVSALAAGNDRAFVFGDIVRAEVADEKCHLFIGDENYSAKLGGWPPEFNHPTFLTRRSTFELCGLFDTNYSVCMDLDWLLRLNQVGLQGAKATTWMVMRCGGISDQTDRMFKDVRSVLLANGAGRAKVWFLWSKAVAKTRIRLLLQEVVGDAVVREFRRRINPQFDPVPDWRVKEAKRILRDGELQGG